MTREGVFVVRFRAYILCALLGTLAGLLALTPRSARDREHSLVLAFNATGATLEEVYFQAWTVIESPKRPKNLVAVFGWNLAEFRGTTHSGPEGSRETFVSSEGNRSRRVTARTLSSASGQPITYISVMTTYRPGSGIGATAHDFERIRADLAQSLKGTGGRPRTSVTLVGELPGLVTTADLRRIAERAVSEAGAVPVESLEEGSLVSLSGFSRFIPAGLKSNGRRFNIQVAASLDELRGTTRITVGSPSILGEY
jgi:hypothetical protein